MPDRPMCMLAVFLYEPNCNCPSCTIPGCPCCAPTKPVICTRCEDKRRKEEDRNG